VKKAHFVFCLHLLFASGLSAQLPSFGSEPMYWMTSRWEWCPLGCTSYSSWNTSITDTVTIAGELYHRVDVWGGCVAMPPFETVPGWLYAYPETAIAVGGVRQVGSRVYFHKFPDVATALNGREPGLWVLPTGEDVLLYDFTWEVGDTITMPYWEDAQYKVTNVYYDGQSKSFELASLPLGQPIDIVVEGIGSSYGLFGLYDPGACSYFDFSPMVPGGSCDVCTEYAYLPAEMPVAGPTLRIYPNPAFEALNIEAGDAAAGQKLDLRLFDVQGRLLLAQSTLPTTFRIPIGELAARGWVLVEITSSDWPRPWVERVWIAK
jgi:hypothetical protein